MKRHIFSPLIARGWSYLTASLVVYTFSAILHEMLVGIPTHNIIGMLDIICFFWPCLSFSNGPRGLAGVAFAGMMFQIPLIAVTLPLEKMKDPSGRVIGNTIFWVSFCLVGQPLGALLYFFAWQAKYGSASKVNF